MPDVPPSYKAAKMKEHPKFVELMPPLTPEEYGQLKKNIVALGYREDEPILLWNDYIIDGHNRSNICKELSITPPTFDMSDKFKDESEVLLWIIDNQLGRRNLPAFVRVELVLKKKPILEEQAKQRQLQGLKQGDKAPVVQNSVQRDKTVEILAKEANASRDSVNRVEFILKNADEKTKEKLRSGTETINRAYTAIKKQGEDRVVKPLNFREQHVRLIKEKKKTQTSRTPYNNLYEVGDVVDINLFEPRIDRIKVLSVVDKTLREFTDEDARLEGGYTLEEFKQVWIGIHGAWNNNDTVRVIRFIEDDPK
jgi:uncharacterized protein YqfB (UPF0267 family)